METQIYVKDEQKYNGGYDIVAMAQAIGVADPKQDSAAIEDKITIVFKPRDGEDVAAAKLINYAHIALQKAGVETDVDYSALRNQLLTKPEEVKGPWQFVFKDSDNALFFLSVLRHTDQQTGPKWQTWITEADETKEGDATQKYQPDHFVKHYFNKIARNYLAQLTGTAPDSQACKFLDGVRQRMGKNLDVIKTARARLSDETKLQRQIEKLKDEDKALVPEAFTKLTAGEIDLTAFKAAVRDKKKEQKSSERAAKKAAAGPKKTASKELDQSAKDRIAQAKAEIESKKAPAGE